MTYNQIFAILMLLVGLYTVFYLFRKRENLLSFWLLTQVLYWFIVKWTGHL